MCALVISTTTSSTCGTGSVRFSSHPPVLCFPLIIRIDDTGGDNELGSHTHGILERYDGSRNAFNAHTSESGLHVLVIALLLPLCNREISADFCGGITGVVPFRSFVSLFYICFTSWFNFSVFCWLVLFSHHSSRSSPPRPPSFEYRPCHLRPAGHNIARSRESWGSTDEV